MSTLGHTLSNVVNSSEVVKISNFIDDEFVYPISNQYIDSFNPATGKIWAQVPASNAEDVENAVRAADLAFKSWSTTSSQYRSRLLMKLADLIEQNLESFAIVESRDQGKSVKLARTVDIPRCVLNFRFFATAILHNTDMCREQQEPVPALNYVQRRAIGVAGLIVPWNLPLYLLSFKLAPALATGNTVVAKPSEFTSATAWLLAHVIKQAGFPAGVVNFVFGNGSEAGESLVTNPLVPLVSFTGSTAVGTAIGAKAAALHKKVSLEMGGKNACIVFPDISLDDIMPTIVRSCFANQGEICLCSSRIFVHETILDEFCGKFVKLVEGLNVGDPTNESTDMGPLVSAQHLAKVQSYRQVAVDSHAQILYDGNSKATKHDLKDGYYFKPMVVSGVKDDSPLMQEEIFGPVVCVSAFYSEDEVIRRANGVEYGLSASVWSSNVNTIHSVSSKLDVGTVWCNCWLVRELNMPFGGVKHSGLGREGAHDSIQFFTNSKNVCIKL